MLRINNLTIEVNKKKILNNISLSIDCGEFHVLMGPNGAGKTSLALTLMGHPSYQLSVISYQSKITIDGKDITHLKTDERAKLGLFVSFQKPVVIPGVSVQNLLGLLVKNNLDKAIQDTSRKLKIKEELLTRSLNENFSGGETRKIELLQALILKPKYLVLDEIDSGLDIDNLRLITDNLVKIQKTNRVGILLITHNLRILKFLQPDRIHILIDGTIKKSDGPRLSEQIEKKGFSWLAKN